MNMLFRLLWIYVRARWQPVSGGLQPFQIRFIVLPTDLDVCRHMNNGTYFSIMDLGRVDLLVRSGLFAAIRKAGYSVTIAAETMSFRRSLTVFQKFTLETRILGWDEKALIIEQRFLRPSRRAGSQDVAAHGIVRARLVSKDGRSPSTGFLKAVGPEYSESPALPQWAAEWNQNHSQFNIGKRSASEAANSSNGVQRRAL